MAVWQVALVKQLRIMGSNPSQSHISYWRKVGGKRRTEGRRWVEERVFRSHNYWLHAPHLYLKNQMKNEIATTVGKAALNSVLIYQVQLVYNN